ncbi:MAG: hypothetical protein H6R04_1733 [Burkholderiaceae bacterium]|nr:hypothetical protein [Burkholderiaceae bacterium]
MFNKIPQSLLFVILLSLAGCTSKNESASVKIKETPQYLPFDRNTPCSVALQGAKQIDEVKDIQNIPVQSQPPEKSEYETTEKFRERALIETKNAEEREEKERISTGYNGFIKITRSYSLRQEYDADNGMLTLKEAFPSNNLPVYLDSKDSRKFDLMIKITGDKDISALYITNIKHRSLHFPELVGNNIVGIKMSVDDAKKLKGNLSSAMIGRLIPPYRVTTNNGKHVAVMETTCAVIFNNKNGEIVYEYK